MLSQLEEEAKTQTSLDLPRIYNRHLGDEPDEAIFVGRPSPWGNPFVLRQRADRDKIGEQFEQYAMTKLTMDPKWLEPLRGKPLVCWCWPRRCHAETLRRLANLPESFAIEAYFDGLCEPAYVGGPRNPGGVAAGGWVVKQTPFWWSLREADIMGNKVYRYGPGTSNNIAEYEAALDALREVYRAKWRGKVKLYGDSKLIVNQYRGSYACKAVHLRELLNQLHKAASYFTSVELIWVPREQNALADHQSRRAYDAFRITQ